MQYKLIGNKCNKDIYFPLDNKERIIWVTGAAGSGKSIVLETLNDYYFWNGIKSALISPESKLFIPIEDIENILCLFKLWNNRIEIDNYSYQAVIKFKKFYSDLSMKEYPGSIYKLLIILNIFYLVTYNDYSTILIDEFYSEYQKDIEYLFEDKNIQIISTLQIGNLNRTIMRPAKNIVLIEDCFKKEEMEMKMNKYYISELIDILDKNELI